MTNNRKGDRSAADQARATRQAARQARAANARKIREDAARGYDDGPDPAFQGQEVGEDGARKRLRQITHERLGMRGLSPKKALGQNFLVSDHVMAQIEGFANVTEDDVVLEIGGGLGVLSERLAERAKHVHIIELDAKLADLLEEILDPEKVTVHRADAVKFDLTSLDPVPNAFIANLPYSVAATVVLRAVHEMPAIERWLVMVQKEVGVRFAARAGTKEYGAPSALAQLSCTVKLQKNVARSAFMPAPHVDSVLMALTRVAPPAEPGVRRLISSGFLHRRKALPRSLSIAIGDPATKDATREALIELGIREDARAEQLTAEEFTKLHAALVARGIGGLA
ncbi:MAG: 16S rRNA (adenine(1518)-N(6)/adenine(1519)-N(6))-dimethyltransferase RsmA [Solirubrobacteraceae bacterium]|nr:16S rRNA (adenine(1518)-N(6)/adenine(1519)-N(6))-dimethyltransferase RsmA [Solirubrobacteraceae bacterium]